MFLKSEAFVRARQRPSRSAIFLEIEDKQHRARASFLFTSLFTTDNDFLTSQEISVSKRALLGFDFCGPGLGQYSSSPSSSILFSILFPQKNICRRRMGRRRVVVHAPTSDPGRWRPTKYPNTARALFPEHRGTRTRTKPARGETVRTTRTTRTTRTARNNTHENAVHTHIASGTRGLETYRKILPGPGVLVSWCPYCFLCVVVLLLFWLFLKKLGTASFDLIAPTLRSRPAWQRSMLFGHVLNVDVLVHTLISKTRLTSG